MALTDFFEEMAPFPAALRPRLRDLGLAGKVLLGSDFPAIPYPYAHQLDALARIDLGDDWLRAVCWENAARLFDLPG
jgi:predicted TIM-barrel fold metal-dependent hydrolase